MNTGTPEIEALNYLFVRVMGQIFLSSYSNPTFNELTGAQRRILYYLDLKGSCRMSEIARLVAVTLPAATAVTGKLVARGFVRRQSDPSDRRVVLVTLTPLGRRTLGRVKQVHERRFKEILARLKTGKRERLVRAFQEIHDILADVVSADPSAGRCRPPHGGRMTKQEEGAT